MAQITTMRTFAASPDELWSVLADYPNICTWNSGVKHSFATSDATSGVGARRHCDLSPFGALEETVEVWDESRRLTISIDSASKLPIASGRADFAMKPIGNGTRLDFTYDYDPKFGPVGRMLVPALNKQLAKGFEGFMDDLETAVAART